MYERETMSIIHCRKYIKCREYISCFILKCKILDKENKQENLAPHNTTIKRQYSVNKLEMVKRQGILAGFINNAMPISTLSKIRILKIIISCCKQLINYVCSFIMRTKLEVLVWP